jgi:stage II sporulation protein D
MVSPIKTRISKSTFFIFCAGLILLAQYSSVNAQDRKYIRVSIFTDDSFFSIKSIGHYEIVDVFKNKVLFSGKDLKATVTVYNNAILIGNHNCPATKILVKADTESIQINGRRFRGEILFIIKEGCRIAVVNYIELEDYVRGILYHETSHYWPLEVLKAQAVISRTFALYQARENASRDYDVTNDVYSQVYGGATSERYRTNIAVEDTKAEVLVYQGKIFPTYFHATCAGHTEDASLLWNISLAPLKGVACGFCKESPHFNWHCNLTKEEIRQALAKSGYKINNIEDILILGKDASGRITKLRIKDKGQEHDISAKDFRGILGPGIIKSANFSISIVNDEVAFEGFGWGHGVGLCQWGAYFMAKEGYSYEKILKYYYPGSELLRI